MEMASIFAKDPEINVVGLVMIECVYPREIKPKMFKMEDIGAGNLKPQLRTKILAGILEADRKSVV